MRYSAAALDLAALAPDAWYRASFPGDPWPPTASAGASGSNGDLIAAGTAPSAGTAVNGFTPASFNGSTQALRNTTVNTSSLVSVSAGTLVVLAKMAGTPAAPQTNFYDDAPLATDSNGNFGLVFTSSGVRMGVWDGAAKQTVSIAQATGSWFLAVGRWNGSQVKCRVNSTSATPVAAGNIPSLASIPYVGQNYDATKRIQGDILEVLTWQRELSDAEVVSLPTYFNPRYALSL